MKLIMVDAFNALVKQVMLFLHFTNILKVVCIFLLIGHSAYFLDSS